MVIKAIAAAAVALAGCATVSGSTAERPSDPTVITVANRKAADLCGLYLWSDVDPSGRSDNRLLPGTVLVGANSAYRLTPGTRRDLVVPNSLDQSWHLEVRDCDGKVIAGWHRDVLRQHEGVFLVASR